MPNIEDETYVPASLTLEEYANDLSRSLSNLVYEGVTYPPNHIFKLLKSQSDTLESISGRTLEFKKVNQGPLLYNVVHFEGEFDDENSTRDG